MNYEEKYKQALERARDLMTNQNPPAFDKHLIEIVFPELKESEDEKIRKGLIKTVSSLLDNTTLYHTDITKEEALAWLEKQDEQKDLIAEIKNRKALLGAEKEKAVSSTDKLSFGARIAMLDELLAWVKKQGKKKSADKVEPKFKIDDWIVSNESIFKITHYEDEYGYELTDTTGCVVHFVSPDYVESKFHLWTIEDAKDGDVLCCESGWTCIFKTLVNDETFSSHCFMDNTKWFCETGSKCHTLEEEFVKAYNGKIYPATKEQRDLLFQKMKEAGYEWDAEKKELKKIEVISKKSEDERIRKEIISFLKDFEKDHYRSVNFNSWIAWLEKQTNKD